MNILEVLLKNTMNYSIMYCSYYNYIHRYVKNYTRMFHTDLFSCGVLGFAQFDF